MTSEDFRVEVIGHATLRVQHRGRTLLTDPWLLDPIGAASGFHFPPLRHDPATLAAETDAIYLSHVHPDHFHLPSLELFRKSVPVYIGAYRRKDFRDAVSRLGFPVIEVPFQQRFALGDSGIAITIVEHDYRESAAYDSAIVIATPDFVLFENNDCFLSREKYDWVRQCYDLDYAFLGYSPASFFPIAFEMDPAEKSRLLGEAAERRYQEFLDAAEALEPELAVPFASGARFLQRSALWKNVAFNSALEAVRRLRRSGRAAEVMGPGDRILADGALCRVSPVLEAADELAAIEAYAQTMASRVNELVAGGRPVGANLAERLRDYLLERWRATRERLPGVRDYVIAYRLLGEPEQRFYFDFSRPEDQIFQWGEPFCYDMRYTYPAGGLQARLDGEIDWDELHFTDEVSIHQIRYAREFYMMLRSEVLELEWQAPAAGAGE